MHKHLLKLLKDKTKIAQELNINEIYCEVTNDSPKEFNNIFMTSLGHNKATRLMIKLSYYSKIQNRHNIISFLIDTGCDFGVLIPRKMLEFFDDPKVTKNKRYDLYGADGKLIEGFSFTSNISLANYKFNTEIVVIDNLPTPILGLGYANRTEDQRSVNYTVKQYSVTGRYWFNSTLEDSFYLNSLLQLNIL